MPAAVLIPIKSFDLAKGRLSAAVDPARRAELARTMAATVIAAGRSLPVWVVCGDATVADFAIEHGADVIWRPPRGLNAAVDDGTRRLASMGIDRAVVAHADLPLATDLTHLDPGPDDRTVLLVPDRRDDGTNVLSLPLGTDFAFHYGPGSAAAHRAEADRCGLAWRNVADEQLAWDVDVPDDLAALDPPLSDHGTAPASNTDTDTDTEETP